MRVFVLIEVDSANSTTIGSASIAMIELEIELSTTMIEEITASEIAATTLRDFSTERFLDGALGVTIFEINSEVDFVNSTIIDLALIAITEETMALEAATATILRGFSIGRLLDSTLIVITFRFKGALPHF